MGVWEFMEQIHSRSYTHIIKNVYADPSEVFDSVLENEKILARAESVCAAYNDFITVATEWANSNMWKPDWKESPTSQWTLKDVKRRLYRAVANVNILEGIRFYVSFACSFAFGETKLMEGSAKIISLIARDEAQHLALTQKILKKWREGDDPEMEVIAEEEKQNVKQMFIDAVDQEKEWANYLFSDGSMIGLNERLLSQYIEWVANRRMRAVGIQPVYDIPWKSNPLPWTEHWQIVVVNKMLLRKLRLSPMSLEVSNKMSKETPSQDFHYKFEVVFDKDKETVSQKIKRWINKQKRTP